MERDFEKEFIQLKQSETPDLWNRIEAGLSDRKPVMAVSETASENPKFFTGKVHWRRWGTLAAACLCAAIIIPAISLVIRNGDGKNYSGSPSSDGSSADNAGINCSPVNNSTAADSCAPAESVESAEEFEESGAAMSGDTGVETSGEGAGGINIQYEPESNEDMSADGNGEDVKTEIQATQEADSAETENLKEYLNSRDLENGQVIERATVQIVKTEELEEDTIYQALVLAPDADNILKKDMQLEIVCDSDTEYDSLIKDDGGILKRNEKYEVSLCYEQDKIIVISVEKSDSDN